MPQYEILITSSHSYTKKSHLTRHTRRSHLTDERPERSVITGINRAANSVTTATTSDDDDDEEDYHQTLVKKVKEEYDRVLVKQEGYNQLLIKQEKEDYDRTLAKQENTLSNQISATVYPSNTINQQPNYWSTNSPCYSNSNNNIIYSSLPTVYQPTGNGYYYRGHQSYYSF